MLDLIVCSTALHKCVKNCQVVDDGADSEEDEQRKLYNKYLLELTSCDMTYNTFCEAVVRAGRETAVSIECKCEGWYKASESILIPAATPTARQKQSHQ